jgi:hypothetical protein
MVVMEVDGGGWRWMEVDGGGWTEIHGDFLHSGRCEVEKVVQSLFGDKLDELLLLLHKTRSHACMHTERYFGKANEFKSLRYV